MAQILPTFLLVMQAASTLPHPENDFASASSAHAYLDWGLNISDDFDD